MMWHVIACPPIPAWTNCVKAAPMRSGLKTRSKKSRWNEDLGTTTRGTKEFGFAEALVATGTRLMSVGLSFRETYCQFGGHNPYMRLF